MFAIIPHKDCLFFLSSAAREIIRAANHSLDFGVIFSPVFPLWAFTESVPENILSLSVLPPQSENKELFFPLKIRGMDSDLLLRIVFARRIRNSACDEKSLKVPPEIRDKLPLVQRTFRQALVVMENNGWKVYDEKWHKCK